MNAKISALINGYAFNGRDFKLLDENGVVQRLSVLSSATLGGVMITKPPSFPSNKDAAHVTFMPYEISLAAELPITSLVTALVSFTETLSFSGGGPVYEYLETRVGPPQRQLATQQSICTATQEGSAVGLYDTPRVPAAIWPYALVRSPQINSVGGRLVGGGPNFRYMYKGVRWRYEFKGPTPFFGTPHHWGSE
jgi:hypothetical protein